MSITTLTVDSLHFIPIPFPPPLSLVLVSIRFSILFVSFRKSGHSDFEWRNHFQNEKKKEIEFQSKSNSFSYQFWNETIVYRFNCLQMFPFNKWCAVLLCVYRIHTVQGHFRKIRHIVWHVKMMPQTNQILTYLQYTKHRYKRSTYITYMPCQRTVPLQHQNYLYP